VSTLIVLTPWRLQLTHHPHTLIDHHLQTEPVSALADVYLDLAYWNGVNYDENGRKLEALLGVFGVACASLVAHWSPRLSSGWSTWEEREPWPQSRSRR
jgi:hypothetical protein